MQRVGILNGENINYDKDFSASVLASLNQGIIDGFEIVGSGAGASIGPGKALIECTRSNGEKIMVFYENTANVPVNMTGTKKVYIVVDQDAIDDGSSNAEDGTGIASITTNPSAYPSSNFVKLYSVASGTPTDDRVAIRGKLLRSGLTAYRVAIIDANGNETLISFDSAGKVLTSNGPTSMPTFEVASVSINSLTEITSVADTVELIGNVPGTGNRKFTKQSFLADLVKNEIAGEALTKGDSIFHDRYLKNFVPNSSIFVGFGLSLSYSTSATTAMGGFVVKNSGEDPVLIKAIRMEANCNATRGLVYDVNGNLQIATCTITGLVGTFATPVYIPAGGQMRILADNSGSSYNQRNATISGNAIFDTLSIVGGVQSQTGAIGTQTSNILSIECEVIKTTTQSIGQANANKKLSIPFIGSGVAGNSMAFSITKFASPSFPLSLRLETDNAGSPSGTLIDANAVVTQSVVGGLVATDAHGKSYSSASNDTAPRGVRFLTKSSGYIKSFNLNTTSSWQHTRAFLKSDAGDIIATGFVAGGIGCFPSKPLLANNTHYRIEVDMFGTNISHPYFSGGVTYTGTYINYVTGSIGGANDASLLWNIASIQFETEIKTTFTFPANVTVPKGTLFWAVLNQNLDVVDANNYYILNMNKTHSLIDAGELFNTSWTVPSKTTTESMPISSNNGFSYTGKSGVRFRPQQNLLLNSVTKDASCNATKFYISSGGVLLANGSMSGNVGTISGGLLLEAGQIYDVEFDNSGSSYTLRYNSTHSSTFFSSTNNLISFIAGIYGGDIYSYHLNLASMSVTEMPLQNRQAINSDLVAGIFMAKTNALYSKKVSPVAMFAKGNTAFGALVSIDVGAIINPFTGLIENVDYYIANNYGGISTTQGRIVVFAGKSVSPTTLIMTGASFQVACDVVSFTRGETTASGVTTYSHSLGKIPEKIDFHMTSKSGSSNQLTTRSSGTYIVDKNKNYCEYESYYLTTSISTGACVWSQFYTSNGYQYGYVSRVTATEFDITWVYGGTSTSAGTLGVVAILVG